MEELKEVLEALARLVTALGPGWTLLLLVLAFGYHSFREWQKEKRESSIADEKEAQIQRLADDNRWMRQVLMKKAMGLTDDEIKDLMGDGKPQPLMSVGGKKESGS